MLQTVVLGEVIVALARVGAGIEQYVAIAVQHMDKNLSIIALLDLNAQAECEILC